MEIRGFQSNSLEINLFLKVKIANNKQHFKSFAEQFCLHYTSSVN